eukprot:scaffold115541_cov15-Prasinocladus_malaysianus.AAC.1
MYWRSGATMYRSDGPPGSRKAPPRASGIPGGLPRGMRPPPPRGMPDIPMNLLQDLLDDKVGGRCRFNPV